MALGRAILSVARLYLECATSFACPPRIPPNTAGWKRDLRNQVLSIGRRRKRNAARHAWVSWQLPAANCRLRLPGAAEDR